MRMSPEDRAAFADARIAAVHAGLKLTPDQEKLWPPVETAVRDFAKLRIDRANARMNAQSRMRQDAQKPDDPVARLRERADNMATTAAAMKKIADAADPLYKTLDDGQKRRLAILTHRASRLAAARAGGSAASSAATDGDRRSRRPGSRRTGQGPRRPGRLRAALGARSAAHPRTQEKPPDSGGFFVFACQRLMTGEYPAGLLDIARSLC